MGIPTGWRARTARALRGLPVFASGIALGLGVAVAIMATPSDPVEVRVATFDPSTDPPAPTLTGLDAGGLPPIGSEQGSIARTESTVTIQDVLPTVVRVHTSSDAGSGVIIDPSGLVLTTAHTVGDSLQVHVRVRDRTSLTGTVVRVDETRDLALVELPPGVYRSAELGSSSDIVWGGPVVGISYPLNLPGPATVTAGVVSRVFDEPALGRQVIQTDAAINIGSSGGPLLDRRGKVIGLISSVLGEYRSFPTSGYQLRRLGRDHPDRFLGPGAFALAGATRQLPIFRSRLGVGPSDSPPAHRLASCSCATESRAWLATDLTPCGSVSLRPLVSSAGNRVITCGPSLVTTTSSSIRAADQPSVDGQKVSRAKTIPSSISTGWSSEMSRLKIGFSQMDSPTPWPY